jgi:hypothetical protein
MRALTRQMRSNALSGQKSLKSVTSTYRPRQECHCGDSAKMAARSQGREELGALVPARMRLAERNNPEARFLPGCGKRPQVAARDFGALEAAIFGDAEGVSCAG